MSTKLKSLIIVALLLVCVIGYGSFQVYKIMVFEATCKDVVYNVHGMSDKQFTYIILSDREGYKALTFFVDAFEPVGEYELVLKKQTLEKIVRCLKAARAMLNEELEMNTDEDEITA